MHIDDEVTARIASVAFGRLRINVWERNGVKLDTKLKVYKAAVQRTLLYACEAWTAYQRHAKRLNHFHLSCLRKLLKFKWQDKISDTEVLKKHAYCLKTSTAKVDRPCYKNVILNIIISTVNMNDNFGGYGGKVCYISSSIMQIVTFLIPTALTLTLLFHNDD